MKKMISLSIVAAVVSLSSAAFAAPVVYTTSGHCNAFQNEQSLVRWDSAAKKLVVVGYVCVAQGGR